MVWILGATPVIWVARSGLGYDTHYHPRELSFIFILSVSLFGCLQAIYMLIFFPPYKQPFTSHRLPLHYATPTNNRPPPGPSLINLAPVILP